MSSISESRPTAGSAPAPSRARPLVSICIPCHNAAAHLRETLASVFAQTYSEIEVIAVCDSSTDGTGEILDAAAKSHRLQVIRASAGSASRSRNLAFNNSRGEFIKYVDSDDLLSPELVELQVARLMTEPGCIASARWKRFNKSVDERDFAPDGTWRDLDAVDWLVESARDGGVHAMMQCGMFLIPRSLIEQVGGWDERLTLIDDTEFFGRVFSAAKRILHTDGALYYRSGLSGSLSGQKSRRAYESAVMSVEGFSRRLIEREDSPRTRRVAADLCQTYYFEIAPFESDLGQDLLKLVAEFGGSRIQPVGGPVFRTLSRMIGWPTAARLRSRAKSLGYERWRCRLNTLWPVKLLTKKAAAAR